MTEHEQPMHIVAGAFRDADQARGAEADLRRDLDLEDRDVDVAELGAVAGSAAVLAARIRAHRVDHARDVVARHGGEVVTDVPEAWTKR